MKATILSSFNKKIALVKNNSSTNHNSEIINTSFNEVINSSSSHGTFKNDLTGLNPEMTINSNSFSGSNIMNIQKKINALQEEKKKAKALIQQWNEDFLLKFNRKPANEDKKQISHLYSTYNNYNAQISILEDKVESIKNLKSQICNTSFTENNLKSKSISPTKAHLSKILQMSKNSKNIISSKLMLSSVENQNSLNNNQTLLNASVNHSFEANTNKNYESSSSFDINKVILENQNLKSELSNLKILNDERIFKNKSFNLTNNFENTLMTEENEENQKSVILDQEQRYNKKLKDLEDHYKKKINEVIKIKDNSFKKLQQDLMKLKSEFEKNVFSFYLK